mmetsp:Transcript_29563/g.96272  ORF Transcript_29563/g.96272 Transcript_29563/m.96272 type:complete len:388 (-) Transcript_29563:70-1233(-)
MPLFVVDAENLCVEIGRLFALVPPRRLEQRPQRFCRGHQRVVRQIAKEVVRCVAVRDVVREMIHAVPEPAVNRLERAEHVVPLPVLKRLRLVRVVLEVRDGEEPPRKDEVRGAVADEPVGQVEARERNGEAEEGCHAGGADGALSALQRRSVEEPRIWVEVRAVRSAPARLEEQVPGEAEERPPRMIEREKAHDWIHSLVFFGVEPRVRVVLRAVVVEAVVLLVRVRPRPVRHEEDGVADVADNVVQALRFAEARVPAVVTDDEAHPHHETRDAGVQRRQERVLAHERRARKAQRSRRQVRSREQERIRHVWNKELCWDARSELVQGRQRRRSSIERRRRLAQRNCGRRRRRHSPTNRSCRRRGGRTSSRLLSGGAAHAPSFGTPSC